MLADRMHSASPFPSELPPHHAGSSPPRALGGWGSTAGLKAGSWEPTGMKPKLLHGCYQPCKSTSLAPVQQGMGLGRLGWGLLLTPIPFFG